MKGKKKIAIIGAGTIGTALGNILSENGSGEVLLISIEENVVLSINDQHINARYFPGHHLHGDLKATTDVGQLKGSSVIFLAIPSVAMLDYLKSIRAFIPEDAILVNLAKGFGCGENTIVECLKQQFSNPVCTLKGPSFAKEIINRIPTGFTLGHPGGEFAEQVSVLFKGSTIHLDFSGDIQGVELLSILKNIYAIVLGIVDAQFNSPNLRFLILTRAFREMMNIMMYFGGKEETMYKYCGYGDFTLTALNDLSRNRTLGLLIGKGFFTEHVSHELVLEGKTAATIFYGKIARETGVEKRFPIMSELNRIFTEKYDVSKFVSTVLEMEEP
ncbi:MAG: NAD(P)-binding domain-containing protein [Bacteroidetes bacterium]|nr:NAD(P)-binding domain-containing protein [Bacteroidota bacterium]